MLEKKEIIESSIDFNQTSKILKKYFIFNRSAKAEKVITLAKTSGQVCLEPPEFARNKNLPEFAHDFWLNVNSTLCLMEISGTRSLSCLELPD